MPRLFTPFYYICSVKYDYVNIETINMRDFAAIDFETANNERTSVCSVGIYKSTSYHYLYILVKKIKIVRFVYDV